MHASTTDEFKRSESVELTAGDVVWFRHACILLFIALDPDTEQAWLRWRAANPNAG